jgi:hypothetical protein
MENERYSWKECDERHDELQECLEMSRKRAFRTHWKDVDKNYQAVEAHRVVRRRGSHICWTIGPQMAVRLSALQAGRP